MSQRTYTVDDVQYLCELVFEQGREQGRRESAALAGSSDLSWSLFKRLSCEDWRLRLLREMEENPHPLTVARRERGLPDYTGGPVDWVTGEQVDLPAALASCA